jgi:hypothetical protein
MNPMDIRDIKGLITLPGISPVIFYFVSVAILLFGALLLTFLVKKKRRKTPSLLPHEVASGALEKLKRMGLPGENGGKEYYVELSRIIREYLTHRYGVRASEMTTEEYLWRMRALKLIPEETQPLLQGLLNRCDLVKFARQRSTPEEMKSSIEAAQLIIGQTKETPSP